jgi:hypothetical protein
MTPTQLKENLIEQLNQAVVQVQQLQGAIAACDELLKEETTEETTEE